MTTRSLAIYLIVGAAILISKTVTSEGPGLAKFKFAVSSGNFKFRWLQLGIWWLQLGILRVQDGTVTVARGTLTGAVTVDSDDLTRPASHYGQLRLRT